jgi:Fe-S-cluster containining protein
MNLCARCAQYNTTCCQKTEIFLTDGDIQRIREHIDTSDFWEYVRPSHPDLVMPQPQDPNWLPYTLRPDGTRPHLKHDPSGDCTFLGAGGCSLPADRRPLICRLYPYDYTETGISGTVTGCPLHLLEPGQTLMQGIGMNRADAEYWRQQLYHELRHGSIWHENRHHI